MKEKCLRKYAYFINNKWQTKAIKSATLPNAYYVVRQVEKKE
jgi:hypothetical protein